MTIQNLASSALEHSDHVEQIVRWALSKLVYVENERAGRVQDCLTHLTRMKEDLHELLIEARKGNG